MPLTEQEREWLERRKNLCERCFYGEDGRPNFCGRWRDGKCIDFDPESCLSENVDYKDAAEFEARVARELTNPTGDYMPLCIPDNCDFHDRHNCRECRLMHARLAVEAEMDNTAGSK